MRDNRLFRGRPKKNSIYISPNPVPCIHQRGFPCYPGYHRRDLAHVKCWRNHFGLTPTNKESVVYFAPTEMAQCVYCGCGLTPPNRSIDHVVPKSRGGSHTSKWNQAPSCKRCNNEKGPLTAAEYLRVKDDPEARYQLIAEVAARIEGRV